MASKRNRILELVKYLESYGITVNIGKNKAFGNNGAFKVCGNKYIINIAKDLSEEEILRVLAHEFAHYIHYKYDKTLNSLDFIFDSSNEQILEELLTLTVKLIPKSTVRPIFDLQKSLQTEIKNLETKILSLNPENKKSSIFKLIEKKIEKTSLKHLLKYDNVRVFSGLTVKNYSINSLNTNSDIDLYLKLQSKKRALKRVNGKISRLNKYYNSSTELFARSFETFLLQQNNIKALAPNIYNSYNEILSTNKIPMMSDFVKKFLK